MSKEYEVIKRTKKINTLQSLKIDLKNLGIKEGMNILVHSSLSSIGWISGGAVALIDALIEIVGKDGNIIMPSQSCELTDPVGWQDPPVPYEWQQIIRDTMPAFDVDKTKTRGMGVVVETFRKYDEVKRSNHPQYSFVAWGKDRDYILQNQSLEYGLSDNSPLGKLYDMDTKVLLIGVDYDNNTSFHLSEYRSNCRKEIINSAPIIENNTRVWKEFKDIELDSDIFLEIGKEFEDTNEVKIGEIGMARCKLFSQKECIDFATNYFSKKSYNTK